MAQKLWEKNVQVDHEVDVFTVGKDREMDLYLAKYDVLGSMAHITMLESIGLLSKEELEVYTLGSLRKAVFDGNVKEGSLMAGQVAGQLHEIRPAAVILEEMYTSFCQLKKDLAKDCD